MRRAPLYITERVLGTDGVSKQGFTFYHRTGRSSVADAEKTIQSILKTGFQPGGGDMYGVGMYGTTDRASSFSSYNVSSYGIGLIKYLVPVKGILIFDYNISALLFGTSIDPKTSSPAYSLESQLVRYGIFSAKSVPEIFQVLSVDLECTFGGGNRRLSAERCYHIFIEGIMNGGSIPQLAKGLSNISGDLVKEYSLAAWTAKRWKGIDKKPGVNGIVFSGNHDGNVIVMYKMVGVKPLAWGVSDPNDPTDPKKWAIPMHPCNGVFSAGNVASVAVDMAADKNMISKKGSVEALFIEGMTLNNINAATDQLSKYAPWLKNNLNGFTAIHCAIPTDGGDSVIYKGQWTLGDFKGYFGGDTTCLTYAEKIIGKKLSPDKYEPEFHRGTFVDGYFAGVFCGGVFQGGQFEGVFQGGLWKYNSKAVWGKNAVFASSPNHLIEYNGKIYSLDCDPDTWIKKQLAIQQTTGGVKNYVDTTKPLQLNLEESLPYKATVSVFCYEGPGIYGPNSESMLDSFKYIREKYAWLWSKLKFSDTPTIIFDEKKGCILDEGTLMLGTVEFDLYRAGVVVNGGVIKGKNEFYGEMHAGIYSEGQFYGTWFGGTWVVGKTDWMNASFTPGSRIGTTKIIAKTTIVIGNKRWDIDPGAYLVWKTIPDLIDGVKSGEYQNLITQAKNSKKKNLGTAVANAIAKKYNNTKFTVDELMSIINDDDDSDDKDAQYNLSKMK